MSTRLKVLSELKPKQIKYKKIMGFDIETSTDKNEFEIACFYAKDFTKICYSKEEVIQFINSKKVRSYYIYATNLAFDFLGTFYEHSHRWSVNERNGVIYSFKWYQTIGWDRLKNPVHFFDTMRILPFSVAKLGKLLKVDKMERPQAFGRTPDNNQEMEELTTYCMNDAKISYLFIEKIVIPFLEKYNIPLKSTIGSIALHDFRRNYLDFALFQEPEHIRELGFSSYYGGRTETFQRGKFKNVYCFDVNSLYPSVMRKAYPNPNRHRYTKIGTQYNINKYEGVSKVKVYVPENIKIPPLPYKYDGKLIFPVGTFEGHYNHNELRNALKYGVKVIEIGEQVVYPKTYHFFEKFVNHHYKERLKLQAEGNPLEIMEKNEMNNLYGKFSFNYKEISSMIPEHEFDFEKHVVNATYLEPMCGDKFISINSKSNDAPIYSFPILSSYITSESRILMYEYLSNKNLQDKIISTDTDSIFIKDYAGEIETSDELGAMKLEDGYPVKEGYFVRPKMYMTEKPKCKGVHFKDDEKKTKKENAILNKKRFMNILVGEEIKQERFVKYRTAIRSEDKHKWGKLTPNQIIEITKNLDLNDTKRLWEQDFVFDEEQDSKPINIDKLQPICSTI